MPWWGLFQRPLSEPRLTVSVSRGSPVPCVGWPVSSRRCASCVPNEGLFIRFPAALRPVPGGPGSLVGRDAPDYSGGSVTLRRAPRRPSHVASSRNGLARRRRPGRLLGWAHCTSSIAQGVVWKKRDSRHPDGIGSPDVLPMRVTVPPLATGVQALPLSPYRTGVAGPSRTRLQRSSASHPGSCAVLLAAFGQVCASKSSALTFGRLWWQCTRCTTWRTGFPPPVPRLHSRPRRAEHWPCLLWPAERVAHTAPVRHVRAAGPVRAPCVRRALPHVVGFPHRRVLCSIRRPSRLRRAFPLTGRLRLPGCPGADGGAHVLRRLSSCLPRPEDAGGPAPPRQHGCSCIAVGVREHPRRPQHAPFEAVPARQGTRRPLRPTGYAVDAASLLFAVNTTTTPPWTHDALRVGGSPFPDRDFHPCKRRQAFLAQQRCRCRTWKLKRSVSCKASAATFHALTGSPPRQKQGRHSVSSHGAITSSAPTHRWCRFSRAAPWFSRTHASDTGGIDPDA